MADHSAVRAPASRWVIGIAVAVAFGAVAAIPLLRSARAGMEQETARLRELAAERAPTLDSLGSLQERERQVLARERGRATARSVVGLHLVIAVDSGTVALMRDGIPLRTAPARFRGARPSPASLTLSQLVERAAVPPVTTVDSLGNVVRTPPVERLVERIVLSDGTVLEGGDAAAAILGGDQPAAGPRAIVISRRDFAAIRPNLVRGMPAIVF